MASLHITSKYIVFNDDNFFVFRFICKDSVALLIFFLLPNGLRNSRVPYSKENGQISTVHLLRLLLQICSSH